MQRSNELHAKYLQDPKLLDAYDRFTRWQLDYLLARFDDMYAQDGYREALDFTMNDLAGIGIAERDWDLARAAPIFSRMLPAGALETLASAARMNVLVLELNIGLTEALLVDGALPEDISERDYWRSYREATTLADCLELVALSIELGATLKSLVRIRSLGMLLRAMRGPAHMAGYGALHGFLESGYQTFRGIPDVDYFLDEIQHRMVELFEAMHGEVL